jgi:hypothetical protein
MTRNNLAVVFSPVIFSLDYDNKKKIKSIKSQLQLLHSNATLMKQQQAQLILNPSTSSSSTTVPERALSLNKLSESSETSPIAEEFPSDCGTSSAGYTSLPVQIESATAAATTSSSLDMPPAKSPASDLNENFIITPPPSTSTSQNAATPSKSTYINKFNRAASSFVSFGSDLKSDSIKESLENFDYMNKVVQLCVSDMIRYSMDLFTVPVENFEKLRLSSVFGSEPHLLDNLYDLEQKKLKKVDFFANNVQIDKTYWSYFDKYEDVSIYYFKNDSMSSFNNNKSIASTATNLISISEQPSTQTTTTTTTTSGALNITTNNSALHTASTSYSSSLFMPQANECFNDKLKLWKCCTLIKKPNLTLDKIMNRIKNERYLWDDDFKEGKVVECLDDSTDLYRYVVAFLPPHPSRDFFELRHTAIETTGQQNTIGSSGVECGIFTSTSVKKQFGNKLIGDIRANMFISKYVVEKLIATDTTTTFKITHYVKLDYK